MRAVDMWRVWRPAGARVSRPGSRSSKPSMRRGRSSAPRCFGVASACFCVRGAPSTTAAELPTLDAVLVDQVLDAIDVSIDAFNVCRLHAGWQLAVPESGTVGVHYVLRGGGQVAMAGMEPEPFSRGDVVIAPSRTTVRLEPAQPVTRGSVLLQPIRCDDREDLERLLPPMERMAVGDEAGEVGITIASGRVRVRYGGEIDLFTHLNHPLVARTEGDVSVDAAFEGMLREHIASERGGRAMMSAYMTQGLIAVLRCLVRDGDERLPWLRALADARLGRALTTMLDDVAASHSLESLAKVAGMSRSSFSEHFGAAFGLSAMDFLREARIRRATELLRDPTASVQSVAGQVGFASRSAFSRAFKSDRAG
ncbi:MAG: AraC family transcriptional regulator, partial [Myxococcales bacterium FL481]